MMAFFFAAATLFSSNSFFGYVRVICARHVECNSISVCVCVCVWRRRVSNQHKKSRALFRGAYSTEHTLTQKKQFSIFFWRKKKEKNTRDEHIFFFEYSIVFALRDVYASLVLFSVLCVQRRICIAGISLSVYE